jgi:OmpA-OmpF porin, OOP family
MWMRSALGACALGLCLAPGAAGAQSVGTDTSVDAQTWWPAAGPTDHLALRSAMVSPSGAVGFGLLAHAMRQPLTLSPISNPTDRRAAVDYAITTDFLWSVGILRRFQLSAAIPVVLAQSGDGARAVNAPGAAALGDTALRDIRVEASWAIVQRERVADARGLGLRLDLGAAIPFGDDKGFNGSGGATFAPMVVVDYRTRALSVTANIGARLRPTSAIADLAVGSVGVLGVGVAVRPIARLGITAEYLNTVSLVTLADYTTTTTQEIFAGVRYATDEAGDIELIAGGAAPLTTAPLVPAWRAVLGVSYAPRGYDTDHDGIVDADDRCRTQPEDHDDFEDEDGCPDLDNDQDGVPDASDRCRDEPEDVDNHDDADGCPDPDNDGDGVEDGDDQCVDVAQGEHPDEARPGCPIPDTDSDGVLDPDDRCVDVAQGDRPDPARAGCPVADADRDGVADAADQCPDVAAGAVPDRFRAGCPDLDADRDGVVGEADRCPDQPETINGVTDADGCPDAGPERVTWAPTGDALRFAVRVAVAPRAQTVSPATRALLQQAAQRIRARGAEITRVLVDVTPGAGPPAQIEAIRQAQVIADVLIGERVPQRLVVPRAAPRGGPALPLGTATIHVETRAASAP